MEPFLAQIIMFGGNFAPRGWALCDGQLLPINSNQALFSLLGTTYGGDGRTTFALPDLRGRTAVHAGNGPGLSPVRLGEKAGTNSTTLSTANMPSHNHVGVLKVNSGNATQTAATANSSIATPGSGSGRSFVATEGFNTTAPDVSMNAGSVTTGNAGGGTSFNNMQPFNTVNYIIALLGTYPSRS